MSSWVNDIITSFWNEQINFLQKLNSNKTINLRACWLPSTVLSPRRRGQANKVENFKADQTRLIDRIRLVILQKKVRRSWLEIRIFYGPLHTSKKELKDTPTQIYFWFFLVNETEANELISA